MTMRVMTAKKLVLAAAGVLAGCAMVGAWAIAQTALKRKPHNRHLKKRLILL